jgi:hypothetical protein
MPQAMFMPSKAGPAAVDVACSRPSRANTISPLVPISTNSVTPPAFGRSVESTPAVMSAPTNPEMSGGKYTSAHAATRRPSVPAARNSSPARAGVYGKRPSGSGLTLAARCIMHVLPATTTSYIRRRAIPASAASKPIMRSISTISSPCSSAKPSACDAICTRDNTSCAWATCGLSAATEPTRAPVPRSSSEATSVVVPMSTATP